MKDDAPKLNAQLPAIGERAEFFHPRTFGVMHRGVVVGVSPGCEASVRVKFDIDGKSYWTYPDRN